MHRLSAAVTGLVIGVLVLPAAAQDAGAGDAPAWAGVYAGAHLEGLLGRFGADTTFNVMTLPIPGVAPGVIASASFPSPDWLMQGLGAGVTLGLNGQKNRVVFGVESDVSLTNLSGSADFDISRAELMGAGVGSLVMPVDGYDSVQRADLNWMSTFRGRLGVTAGKALIYGTAGVAIAGVTTTSDYFALQGATVVPVSAKSSGVRFGWTIGGGTEIAVTPHLSVKGEYLYSDFGTFDGPAGSYIDTPGIQQTVSTQSRLSVHTGRIGINWHR
jgi:outer membrane immunogenic protein